MPTVSRGGGGSRRSILGNRESRRKRGPHHHFPRHAPREMFTKLAAIHERTKPTAFGTQPPGGQPRENLLGRGTYARLTTVMPFVEISYRLSLRVALQMRTRFGSQVAQQG